MHHFKPIHAYLILTLVVILIFAKDQANQYDNQVAACERGNIVREAIVNNSQIIRSNLRAAVTVDSANPDVVAVYRENIQTLTRLIAENGSVDCGDTISKPRYLP